MAGLKGAPSRLTAAPTAIGQLKFSGTDRDAQRDRLQASRAWYGTAAWRRLRWQVLTDALFTCAMCGRTLADTSKLVGDHIQPHNGDRDLFFMRSNVQCLCETCHSAHKQRAERRARGGI